MLQSISRTPHQIPRSPTRWRSSAGIVLFSLEGKALDYVQLACDDILVDGISGTFLTSEAADGTILTLGLEAGGYLANCEVDYELYYDDGTARKTTGKFDYPRGPDADEVCRIGVRDNKLCILTPGVTTKN